MINLIDFELTYLDYREIYDVSETLDQYLYHDLFSKTKAEYSILSKDEIHNLINQEIIYFSNLMKFSFEEARGILITNSWIIEAVFDLKINGKSVNEILKNVHTVLMCEEFCDNCSDKSVVVITSCGHRICKKCAQNHFEKKFYSDQFDKLSYRKEIIVTEIDDVCLLYIFEKFNMKEEYMFFLFSNYAKCSGKFVKCPNHLCDSIIKVNQIKSTSIECQCGLDFCFLCLNRSHSPVSCKLLKIWKIKIDETRISHDFTNTIFKKCPRCLNMVSREGASNLIICPNLTCSEIFCWLCFDSRSKHKINQECLCYKSKNNSEIDILIFYGSRFLECQRTLASMFHYTEFIILTKKSYSYQTFSKNFELMINNLMKSLIDCQRVLMYTIVLLNYIYENTKWTNLINFINKLAISIDQVCFFIEFEYPLSHISTEKLIETLTFKISSCKNSREDLISKIEKEIVLE